MPRGIACGRKAILETSRVGKQLHFRHGTSNVGSVGGRAESAARYGAAAGASAAGTGTRGGRGSRERELGGGYRGRGEGCGEQRRGERGEVARGARNRHQLIFASRRARKEGRKNESKEEETGQFAIAIRWGAYIADPVGPRHAPQRASGSRMGSSASRASWKVDVAAAEQGYELARVRRRERRRVAIGRSGACPGGGRDSAGLWTRGRNPLRPTLPSPRLPPTAPSSRTQGRKDGRSARAVSSAARGRAGGRRRGAFCAESKGWAGWDEGKGGGGKGGGEEGGERSRGTQKGGGPGRQGRVPSGGGWGREDERRIRIMQERGGVYDRGRNGSRTYEVERDGTHKMPRTHAPPPSPPLRVLHARPVAGEGRDWASQPSIRKEVWRPTRRRRRDLDLGRGTAELHTYSRARYGRTGARGARLRASMNAAARATHASAVPAPSISAVYAAHGAHSPRRAAARREGEEPAECTRIGAAAEGARRLAPGRRLVHPREVRAPALTAPAFDVRAPRVGAGSLYSGTRAGTTAALYSLAPSGVNVRRGRTQREGHSCPHAAARQSARARAGERYAWGGMKGGGFCEAGESISRENGTEGGREGGEGMEAKGRSRNTQEARRGGSERREGAAGSEGRQRSNEDERRRADGQMKRGVGGVVVLAIEMRERRREKRSAGKTTGCGHRLFGRRPRVNPSDESGSAEPRRAAPRDIPRRYQPEPLGASERLAPLATSPYATVHPAAIHPTLKPAPSSGQLTPALEKKPPDVQPWGLTSLKPSQPRSKGKGSSRDRKKGRNTRPASRALVGSGTRSYQLEIRGWLFR
ncbi:hypothetical protein FB451DRAFT_1171562 [Mycena latifolia]|nr:hypothetical protein FB451DRAFT_1171562 [Mycena latifolia]